MNAETQIYIGKTEGLHSESVYQYIKMYSCEDKAIYGQRTDKGQIVYIVLLAKKKKEQDIVSLSIRPIHKHLRGWSLKGKEEEVSIPQPQTLLILLLFSPHDT